MNIKKWQNGLKLYLKNAIQLRDDGETLMEKGSYGHAYFSFYTALEELGVASIILENYHDPKPNELQKFIKSKGSHKKKSQMLIFDSFAPKIQDLNLPDNHMKEAFQTGEAIEEFYARKLDEGLEIWEKRNKGIYVSLDKNKSDWNTPQDFTVDDLDAIHQVINKQIDNMENALRLMERLRKLSRQND